MNTRTKLAIAASAAMWMVPITNAVAGVDVQAGDWKIDFAGNVNAFYVGTKCDDPSSTTAVTGGLACVSNDRSSSIRNGLLPAALVFSATSRQADLDIDVTIGFYPGINSDLGGGAVNGSGNPSALASRGSVRFERPAVGAATNQLRGSFPYRVETRRCSEAPVPLAPSGQGAVLE